MYLGGNMRVRKLIFERILPILLILTLIVRVFSYDNSIYAYEGLDSSPYSKGITLITLLAIWFQFTATLTVTCRPFFNIKSIRFTTRFIVPLVYLLNLLYLNSSTVLLTGTTDFNIFKSLLLAECLLGLIIAGYYFIIDLKEKVTTKAIFVMIGIWLLLMIPTMPTYFLKFAFGLANPLIKIIDISFAHRIFLYLGIIIPLVMYFLLRDKEEVIRRFVLIFVSCGVLIGFMIGYDFASLKEPWSWPIHLCNTALFIIPICLIFKLKKLFYFTYFINVLGALFAMLMPNYSSSTNMFDPGLIRFWYNHWVAFFMPLLIVALKIFKRPKIKEFYYSMVGFFAYFVIALVCNVLFTAMGHDVDFFFINSDFIADKLGKWAEHLFEFNVSLDVMGYQLVFRPIYQILFFIVYVALGFAEWFVYAEFFRIADSHYDLHVRLIVQKQQKLEYLKNLTAEQKEEMMNNNNEIKLELKHFSKKYGTNKHYSVKDASFEVFGGEIFGFLGPNGAGKSTIIKSVVGIQPLSEGAIEICGYDVTKEPTKAKFNVGYVPDHYALYEKLTGREYINYIADIFNVTEEERNERLERYIKIFQLEHAIDSKIATYSHGMKQKITIMSALVHNPKVWILDEPLTGLDPNSIFQVKECMRIHASEGNIVFFSSHLIDIVEKLCQRIAIIRKGQILCVKTLEEIEATGKTLEEFYMQTIEQYEEEVVEERS